MLFLGRVVGGLGLQVRQRVFRRGQGGLGGFDGFLRVLSHIQVFGILCLL